MPHKCETRADEARVSRKRCGGCFRDLLNPLVLRAQFRIVAYHIRRHWEAIEAALTHGGARSD